MAAIVVIPARFGSTRFPAKILASQTGKPMVQHVVEQAKQARRAREVVVATDDTRIVDALRPFQTRCIMTSPAHQSGTDRVAEVARDVKDEIIVNVQGDEPEIEPTTIDALIERLETSADDMATAAAAFPADADPNNPNLVKVVIAPDGRAIYFSRAGIPFHREPSPASPAAYYLHLGIYAYRREFLLQFASWPPTPLETIEKLEQLRVLEHGRSIHVLKVSRASHGIDTPQQYAEFVEREKQGREVRAKGQAKNFSSLAPGPLPLAPCPCSKGITMTNEDLLAKVGQSAEETEFYTPMPAGYRKGHHKYIVVVGTVMSGLGKGIFASSLAKLLQDKGLRVAPIKMEGYLNIDSGTLNPYRHGEVFVLDDGMETDMDLGTYERLLDQDLSGANFTTNGQILSAVLKKEREGGYLGRDVQVIPHVTGEVKLKLRELAAKNDADVVFVEVGGTVGDYENAFYLEACRQLAYEEGEGSVIFVALTYVLEPGTLGEQKSKAAQLGIKRLMEMGIMPSLVACRAANPVNETVRQKISMYTNVPMRRVSSMHDVESIYLIPESLREAGMDREVLTLLDLHDRVDQRLEDQARLKWRWFVDRIGKSRREITIGITGKYTALRDSYASIIKAAEHCGVHLGVDVKLKWIDTTTIDHSNVARRLADCRGIIVPGGFGVRGTEGKIECIRHARENKIPFLGLCLGFQMAVIEFARNVCGIADANSTEFDPRCTSPVIDILPDQKKIEGLGGNMRLGGKDVDIKPRTLISKLYNDAARIRLRFRHRYEVDPKFIQSLESNGLIFSGKAPSHPIMQILELPEEVHPFFLGTQAHPELTSRPLRPDPMFLGFIEAAMTCAESPRRQTQPA